MWWRRTGAIILITDHFNDPNPRTSYTLFLKTNFVLKLNERLFLSITLQDTSSYQILKKCFVNIQIKRYLILSVLALNPKARHLVFL